MTTKVLTGALPHIAKPLVYHKLRVCKDRHVQCLPRRRAGRAGPGALARHRELGAPL